MTAKPLGRACCVQRPPDKQTHSRELSSENIRLVYQVLSVLVFCGLCANAGPLSQAMSRRVSLDHSATSAALVSNHVVTGMIGYGLICRGSRGRRRMLGGL